ncbi:MAG: hypothetical protein RLZZ293_501 [Pseudomonadota bacterium]|jgi:hypothetical protein
MKKLAMLAILGAISSSVFATTQSMKMYHYTNDDKTIDAYVVAFISDNNTLSGYALRGITLNGSNQGNACKINLAGWPNDTNIDEDFGDDDIEFGINSIKASGEINLAINDTPSGSGFIKFKSTTVNVNNCVYSLNSSGILNLVDEVNFPN